MSVQKFRSIEEMNAAASRDRHEDAQAAFDRFARHCARYWLAAPRSYPRGVFKFRSIEAAQTALAVSHQPVAGPERG